jgi:hypothetical protein
MTAAPAEAAGAVRAAIVNLATTPRRSTSSNSRRPSSRFRNCSRSKNFPKNRKPI